MIKRISKCLLLFLLLGITGCGKEKYLVRVIDDKGDLIKSYEVTKGDNLSKIEEPTKEGYLFVSFLKDGVEYDQKTPINENIVLKPKFISIPELSKLYTVTFNFGQSIKTQKIKKGDKAKQPQEPKRNKYRFIGWYLDDQRYDFDLPVDHDITLIAKYELVVVSVTFDLDGGKGVQRVEIDLGAKAHIPKDPTKTGYHFLGWYQDGKLFNFDAPIYKDTIIKAKWQKIDYVKVTFDSDGGNYLDHLMIEKGSKLGKLNDPHKEGYRFISWRYLDQEYHTDMIINEDITLKAIYEKIE